MNTNLICYAFFDGTYEFIAQIQGDYDPEVPGNILWPRNTTTIAPPKYGKGTIPVFNPSTKVWGVQPDFRGQYGFDPDGQPVLITKAGDPTTFKPPLTKTTPSVPPPDNVPETDPNLALRTSKVAFFRRTTDAEAAQFREDLQAASDRLREIFDAVTYLVPGTDEYPQLRAAVEARVGKARADELLAPSND